MFRKIVFALGLAAAGLMGPAPASSAPISGVQGGGLGDGSRIVIDVQKGGGGGGRGGGGGSIGGGGGGGGRGIGGGGGFGGGRGIGGGGVSRGGFGGGGRAFRHRGDGPRVGGVGRHRHHGHRHRNRRGGIYFGYGAPYYYNDYYTYSSSCEWLRRRALRTGSSYWWNRYRNCVDDYY